MNYVQSFPNKFKPYAPPSQLAAAVQELERQGAIIHQPKDRLFEAAQKLRRIYQGELPSHSMTNREARALAWALNMGQPAISSGPELMTALKFFQGTCGPKVLNGLITSFLMAKQVPAENMAPWAALIRRHLEQYQGRFEELLHWKTHMHLVFAPDAAKRIGEWCLRFDSIQQAFATLRLPEGSAIYLRSLQGAILAVAGASDFPKRVDELMRMVDQGDPRFVKFAADKFLLSFCRKPMLPPHEVLIDVTVRRLGDPRLTRNTQWGDMSEESRLKFQSWLARADLELFFRAVVMDADRRNFWLRYVDQMTYSRLVLGDAVVHYSDQAIQQFLKQKLHARLDDSDPISSAFIFRIKNYLFVEFSQTGDACYIYDLTHHPINLDLPVYVKSSNKSYRYPKGSSLKNRDMALGRILHHSGWESRAADTLRKLGIHAGQQGYR